MLAFRLLSVNAKKNAPISVMKRPSATTSNEATTLSSTPHAVRRGVLANRPLRLPRERATRRAQECTETSRHLERYTTSIQLPVREMLEATQTRRTFARGRNTLQGTGGGTVPLPMGPSWCSFPSRSRLPSGSDPTSSGSRAIVEGYRGTGPAALASRCLAELLGTPFGRSSHSPDPMGGDFSGSGAVTSRNPLLHDGATNATWSGRFDLWTVPPCRSRVLGAELDESLATPNFREFLFLRRWVNREWLLFRTLALLSRLGA
jgi:hypothetical protein